MKKTMFCGLMLSVCSMLFAAPNQAKIDAVARGELKEARLSWWGFDKEDSTAIIQAALASKATTIIVDKMETPWITKPLFLHSDMTLAFENGAELLAKRGEFKGSNDCLITIEGQKNVNVIGRGPKGVLRMWKCDYQDPTQYRKAEWRHALKILSSDNILVKNMTMAESGGDGLYVAASNKTPNHHSTNVTFSGCVCDKNHRQGISIISAIHLLIEDCVLSNTKGTPPEAGIDFEPNNADEPLIDCVMRNCLVEGNTGSGIEGYLAQMDTSRSGDLSITVENCTVRNNRRSYNMVTRDYLGRNRARKGTFVVRNCTFAEGNMGNAISFDVDMHHDMDCIVENCKVQYTSAGKGSPVLLVYHPSGPASTKTRFTFDNLQIINSNKFPWLCIDDSACIGVNGYHIKGSVTEYNNGKTQTATIDREYLKKYFPARQYADGPYFHKLDAQLKPAKMEAAEAPLKIRQVGTFWLYARKGENVNVTIRYTQLIRNKGVTQPVTVIYPSGKETVIGKVDFNTSKELAFQAEEGGILKLKMPVGNNMASIGKCSVPCGYCQFDGLPMNLIYVLGDLYFYVPATAKNSAICLKGDGFGEGVNAALFDPAGKKVFQGEDICQIQELPLDNAKPGIWRLQISRPTHVSLEDLSLTLIQIPPYIANKAEWVPVLP